MTRTHSRNGFERLDSDEAASILADAARALAERGWTATRLVAHFGLSHEVAQEIVDEVSAKPTTKVRACDRADVRP